MMVQISDTKLKFAWKAKQLSRNLLLSTRQPSEREARTLTALKRRSLSDSLWSTHVTDGNQKTTLLYSVPTQISPADTTNTFTCKIINPTVTCRFEGADVTSFRV